MSEQKMNPDVKARWVAALRSGVYRQGDARVLNDGNGGFCCLGVLCDLFAKDAGVGWEPSAGAKQLVGGGIYYPPPFVRDWAFFHEDRFPVAIAGIRASVAIHNDGVGCERRSFAEIADAIEAQL